MSLLDDVVLYGGYAVQLAAYLVLTVACLIRLRHRWALVGMLGGLLALVTTGWYLVTDLAIRFADDRDTLTFFFDTPLRQVSQLATTLGVVLVVVAVLAGRRPPEPDHSGPTGTTFRYLPGDIRWE